LNQANSETIPSKAALGRVTAIIIAGGLVLAAIFLLSRSHYGTHKLELKAYFKNAGGLRSGAPVRVNGVQTGAVTGVRVRAEHSDSPAEVLMRLETSYRLVIPKDAVAELAAAGLLGETFLNIDITQASGPPANSGDELKVREAKEVGAFEFYFGPRRSTPEKKPTPAAPQTSRPQ
jgi:ABC-type transporter Mla subunit MlaD